MAPVLCVINRELDVGVAGDFTAFLRTLAPSCDCLGVTSQDFNPDPLVGTRIGEDTAGVVSHSK